MQIGRREVLKAAAAGAVGAVTGLGAHGYLYERHALRVVTEVLPVSGLAPAHDGLRIGFITDIHHSEFVSQADVARAVDRLQAQAPDLIVLGGDYVTKFDNRYLSPCVDILRTLTAPAGVYAILGNHDDERATSAALRRVGVPVLNDARTSLVIRNEPIDLVGIGFWTRQVSVIADRIKGQRGPVLLLAHDPRRLTQAAALAIPAVLSGHTHGGQVVLPGLGAIAAGRRFPILAGRGEKDGTSIFVSRGVGTVYVPVRIGSPPDVAVLTLKARETGIRSTAAFGAAGLSRGAAGLSRGAAGL